MSDYERNKGKLIPTGDRTLSLESRCAMICDEHGWEKFDSWKETVEEEGYRTYFVRNNDVFKIEGGKVDDLDEFFDAKDINGVINFDVRFYNGGCSLGEALDIAVEKLFKQQPEELRSDCCTAPLIGDESDYICADCKEHADAVDISDEG